MGFTVSGPPVGFIAQWDKRGWTTRSRYRDFAEAVRLQAAIAGLRSVVATRDRPLVVHTRAFFANGTHPDPENVHKAVVDALFYGAKGRDKYTGGAYSPPRYDRSVPRVEVVVADGRRQLRDTIPAGW